MKLVIVYPRYKLLVLTFIIEGGVLGVALLLAGLFKIKLLPLTTNLFRDILLGTYFVSFPLSLFVFLLSERAEGIPLIGSLRKTIITDIKGIFSKTRFIDICLISILAGFAEELLFRGVIQVKLGIIATSIIFGFLHFLTPAYCIFATIMGFYIGILFYKYQSILIPIQVHVIYDFGALVYLRYFVKV
ncbi:MAG: CPBP family intramembrane metalloprotease [Candidatus Brocadia sp.]|nr:CPBP family intramembrane metalloprotease [Candidatus Brocadia sp.]